MKRKLPGRIAKARKSEGAKKLVTGHVTAVVFRSKVVEVVEIALQNPNVTEVTIGHGSAADRRSIKAELLKRGYRSLPCKRGKLCFAPRPRAHSRDSREALR